MVTPGRLSSAWRSAGPAGGVDITMEHLIFSVQAVQTTHSGRDAAPGVKLDIKDVWSIVDQSMKVTHEQIDGVQQLSNRRWDVTLHPQARDVYTRLQIDFMDREITTSTGKLVKITDPLENITEVTVRKVPMHWNQRRVPTIFSKYGTIKHIRKERYRQQDAEGTTFIGLWNGSLRIKMVVRTPIPSGLTIADTTLEIFYRNQQPTCRTCGLIGHKFYECETQTVDRINVFNMGDFPELPTGQQQAPQQQQAAADTEAPHQQQQQAEAADTEAPHHHQQQQQQAAAGTDAPYQQQQAAAGTEEPYQQQQQTAGTEAPPPQQPTGPLDTPQHHTETSPPPQDNEDEHLNDSDSSSESDSDAESFSSASEPSMVDSLREEEELHNQATPVEHRAPVGVGDTATSSTTSTPIANSAPSSSRVTDLYSVAGISDMRHPVLLQNLPSNNSANRRFSERRPRSSSTTTAEEDDIDNNLGPAHTNDIEDDHGGSEPFSQVFVNRTKERMSKKKHKKSENSPNLGYWV